MNKFAENKLHCYGLCCNILIVIRLEICDEYGSFYRNPGIFGFELMVSTIFNTICYTTNRICNKSTKTMKQYPVRWITTELTVGYAPRSHNDLAAIRAHGIDAIVNLCWIFSNRIVSPVRGCSHLSRPLRLLGDNVDLQSPDLVQMNISLWKGNRDSSLAERFIDGRVQFCDGGEAIVQIGQVAAEHAV